MADRAHSIPAPEVHPLTGSSPPGAGTPGFEPVASSTRPQARASSSWLDEVIDTTYNRATHPERDLIAVCGDAADAVAVDEEAWTWVDDLENEADPGLAHARKTSAAVLKASATVASLQARTPEGLAAKATFLSEVLFPQNKIDHAALDRVGDHAECLFSLLENARWIGSCSRFSIARLVGLQADPPVRAPAEGWDFQHLMQDWAREAIVNDVLDEMFDEIRDQQARLIPDADLFVRVDDAELFKLPAGCWTIEGVGECYGALQMEALFTIMIADSPGLDATCNARRRRRAQEILTSHRHFQEMRDEKDRKTGIAFNRRSFHWRSQNEGGMRQRILSTPVKTLDGLLMKTLMMLECMGGDMQTAAEELEDELIAENKTAKQSDTVIASSIILDLVRIVIANKITVRSISGEFERPLVKTEVAA